MAQATTASPPSSSPEQDATADLHVTSTSPALIEWKYDDDDATTLLSDPDPRSHHITFQMRHLHDPQQPAASFALHIPAKLKGSSRDTQILITIPSDRILSLDHESPVTAPNTKLGSRPLCRLTFSLRQPVDIIVPVEVPVAPLRALKAATGQVLDLLPSLGRVTRLVLYLPANAFPKHKLEPICAAIAEGRLESTDRSDDLTSLYSGSGGQILRFDDPNDAPPLYDELPPAAPMAPLLPESSSKGTSSRKIIRSHISANRPPSQKHYHLFIIRLAGSAHGASATAEARSKRAAAHVVAATRSWLPLSPCASRWPCMKTA